jgi:glyoxylase-like metal-dependent hydrolase (beta-lactamase superfamily II)
MQYSDPVDNRLPWIRNIADLHEARGLGTPAARIDGLRRAGRRLGDELRAGNRVLGVKTLENAVLPYPTRFAFNGVVPLPWPMVLMIHRTLLIQLKTEDGVKNVLFNPTDAEASANTPFFAKLQAKLNKVAPFAERLLKGKLASLEDQLADIGLAPSDIHVIAFDHFHTQDLRRTLGSRFPKAFLLAPANEWNDWDGLHPMQRAWFIEDGKKGLDESRVVLTNDDLAIGEGCLLLRTPGHTVGNQTLFVHGSDGVFGCCENGCSADNWSPSASAIPGFKRFVDHYEVEVVLNANTPELGGEQYASMVLEKSVADPVPDRPEFVQMFPSSEVTASAIAPRIKPSMVFTHRDSGRFLQS